MPDTPLYLPTPQRPDAEATWAELARFGTTAGDAYNTAGSAWDGVVEHDGRLDGLEGRTDLLEGVVAYGNLSMDKNQWVIEGAGHPGRWMPYSQQVGPRKGVNLVTIGAGNDMGNGFQLLSAGLWRVDVFTQVWDTPFTGNNWADLEIQVLTPTNSIYEVKRFTVDCPEGVHMTIGGPHSFVVPAMGYKVFAVGRAGRWRRFMGGTLYSTFSINKWDNDTYPQAPGTVPDSPAP
ncbi:hypothetical protein ACH47B_06470 [Rhodococcus sp. NPDC019627]|uniref:hypothetical protein n=1 Tax=unclassified Rhodococcus (in: high G+C Gram-positive bacteria) TaxID=192944 RepID=UPI0037A86F70